MPTVTLRRRLAIVTGAALLIAMIAPSSGCTCKPCQAGFCPGTSATPASVATSSLRIIGLPTTTQVTAQPSMGTVR